MIGLVYVSALVVGVVNHETPYNDEIIEYAIKPCYTLAILDEFEQAGIEIDSGPLMADPVWPDNERSRNAIEYINSLVQGMSEFERATTYRNWVGMCIGLGLLTDMPI